MGMEKAGERERQREAGRGTTSTAETFPSSLFLSHFYRSAAQPSSAPSPARVARDRWADDGWDVMGSGLMDGLAWD